MESTPGSAKEGKKEQNTTGSYQSEIPYRREFQKETESQETSF